MESQESLLFNHMLPVKIRPAISKLWQVEHEINNKIDIYEVVIVGPISCGDTECLVSLGSVNINTNRGRVLGKVSCTKNLPMGELIKLYFYSCHVYCVEESSLY